jgi:hypothetical protein
MKLMSKALQSFDFGIKFFERGPHIAGTITSDGRRFIEDV